MTLTQSDFDYVRALIRAESAIVLEPGKEYLVDSRLTMLARTSVYDGVEQLVKALREGRDLKLKSQVIDAMTTNETSFLRDVAPFESLVKSIIPDLLERRAATKTLNIWSAACSSGQEPYSIAMLIRHHFPELASWRVNILATDISGEIVAKAKAGRFAQIEANRGLPADLLAKYFTRAGMGWDIKEEIRSMVEFRQMNLTRPFPSLPTMDVIFVRNVLIYFDVATKSQVISELAAKLADDGYLYLGASESMVNVHDGFSRTKHDRAGCYVRT